MALADARGHPRGRRPDDDRQRRVFYLLTAIVGVEALRLTLSRDPARRARAVLPGAVVLIVAGNTAFLSFTYLAASFGDEEARTAASFWRYSEQAGLAVTLALAHIFPWNRLALPYSARATAAVCLSAAFAPLVAPAFVHYDWRNSALGLEAEADEIAQRWRWQGPIALLDMQGNGYRPMVIAFRLHEQAIGDPKDAVPVSVWSLPRAVSVVSDSGGGIPIP